MQKIKGLIAKMLLLSNKKYVRQCVVKIEKLRIKAVINTCAMAWLSIKLIYGVHLKLFLMSDSVILCAIKKEGGNNRTTGGNKMSKH